MQNLDQITEQGASLDLQGLVILKDRKIRKQKSTDRAQVSSGDSNKGVKGNQRSLFWIHLQNMQARATSMGQCIEYKTAELSLQKYCVAETGGSQVFKWLKAIFGTSEPLNLYIRNQQNLVHLTKTANNSTQELPANVFVVLWLTQTTHTETYK